MTDGRSEPAEVLSADALFKELAAARLRYEEATDPDERQRLGERLDELRNDVRSRADTGVRGLSDDQLGRQADHLRGRLDDLERRRWSPTRVAFSRGSSGGFDRWRVDELNRQLDSAEGRDSLERRLTAISTELGRRIRS